jgi:DNA-binding LacI/PurR family transcriptional regulator
VPVTIHEVAKLAGVSPSTVSRTFTTPDLVHSDTLERVREIAERLGYRPNRAARGLITGKTGNIGIVVPDLANPFFPGVVKAAQARARESDFAVFLADSDEDPRAEVDLIRAMAKQVDGIVVCSSRMSPAQLEQTIGLTTFVFLNRRVPGVPVVHMDSSDGVRQALEHLAALGHQRCAYLNGPRNSWSNRERRRGLRAGAKLGLEIVEFGPFAPVFEAGLQAADLLLASGVTAVLAYNDLIALGVLARLADRRVDVPGDVSVIGFDDIALAGMGTPALTTVAMPTAAAGRAAVDLLISLLADGPNGDGVPTLRALRTQLIVRASTAPPATSRALGETVAATTYGREN